MEPLLSLIADSGSTKTDWALTDGRRIKTQGINPFHMDEDTIRHILTDELLSQMDGACVGAVWFYGSGVRPELEVKMQRLLHETFPSAATIEAKSDLLGAARALCGRHEGIACILGTGANSCYYDGRQIVSNTPALGYVLGDEGSGANLGIRFLNALYKGQLPREVLYEFESSMQLSLTDIIQRVYRQPMANRFLASLSPFIHAHLDLPLVNAIVVGAFRDFLRKNIDAYGRRDLPVSAVGSIAFCYQEQWAEALKEEGYERGIIVRSPIDGLVQMEHL